MSQYLTKEEIKQWRSSLEKITLEEYARRLGKTLDEDKKTSDIIDIVMQNEKRLYTTRETSSNNKVLKIAQKAQNVQNEILNSNDDKINDIKNKLTCLKPLTDRENLVLTHFIKNKGEIVYARDLAAILDLPCDYVYKYIKNLRTKVSQDILKNAAKGGYVFNFE